MSEERWTLGSKATLKCLWVLWQPREKVVHLKWSESDWFTQNAGKKSKKVEQSGQSLIKPRNRRGEGNYFQVNSPHFGLQFSPRTALMYCRCKVTTLPVSPRPFQTLFPPPHGGQWWHRTRWAKSCQMKAHGVQGGESLHLYERVLLCKSRWEVGRKKFESYVLMLYCFFFFLLQMSSFQHIFWLQSQEPASVSRINIPLFASPHSSYVLYLISWW